MKLWNTKIDINTSTNDKVGEEVSSLQSLVAKSMCEHVAALKQVDWPADAADALCFLDCAGVSQCRPPFIF